MKWWFALDFSFRHPWLRLWPIKPGISHSSLFYPQSREAGLEENSYPILNLWIRCYFY